MISSATLSVDLGDCSAKVNVPSCQELGWAAPPHTVLNNKEDVTHMYNAILLSYEKEQKCAICRHVDLPRDCHKKRGKSERQKQILYVNTYMWSLEKWYWWPYLQNRNKDTDVEDKT